MCFPVTVATWLEDSRLHAVSSREDRETASSGIFSCKGTNPIMGPRLDLFVSKMPLLLTPSWWRLGLRHMDLGGHNSVSTAEYTNIPSSVNLHTSAGEEKPLRLNHECDLKFPLSASK